VRRLKMGEAGYARVLENFSLETTEKKFTSFYERKFEHFPEILMARIGIDATSISGKGVERFQKDLVESLARLNSNHEYYVFLKEGRRFMPFVTEPNWHFITISKWKSFLWEQIGIPYWIQRLRLDLFHVTTDRLPYIGKGRFVLQLFEIPNHRVGLARRAKSGYPLYSRVSNFLNLSFFPHSLNCATRILVSSGNTKKELMATYRVDPKKIHVIPLSHETVFMPANDPRSILEIREKFEAPTGYILHFSTQDPRENTEAVLAALPQAKVRIGRGIKLLIIGCEKYQEADVVCRGYLDGRELIRAYQGALVYVDPSLYEGFALQVLEAMACGVPVIASSRSSIPEIVGDAGILIDPENPAALAEAIVRVLTDDNLRNEMCQKGLERAKQFSWEKVARETLLNYQEILNQ